MNTETINHRVRLLRKEMCMSQAEFAENIGLTYSAISSIETGRAAVTDTNIKAICFTFGVRETWLHEGTGLMFSIDPPYKREMLKTFDGLMPESQNYILDCIKKLAEMERKIQKKLEKQTLYASESAPIYAKDSGRLQKISFVGRSAAGMPREAFPISDESVYVPARLLTDKQADYYCVQVCGLSMQCAGIKDGDIALIKQTNIPEYGKINLIHVNGEFTLKRLELKDGKPYMCWEDGSGQSILIDTENYQVQGVFVAIVE